MRAWQIALGLVIVAAVIFLSRGRTSKVEAPESALVSAQESVAPQDTIKVSSPVTTIPTLEVKPTAANEKKGTSEVDMRPVLEQMPRAADVREEVKANPHSTPVSVVMFSAMLYERMQSASQDPKQAASLFTELRDCVTTKEDATVSSVRALCLLNAKRLGAKFSGLAGDLHQLQQSADPKVVQLLNVLEI